MTTASSSIFMLILLFEVETAVMLNTTNTNKEYCDDYWTYYDEKCYRLFNKKRYFKTAQSECRQNNGHLVAIRNEKENTFVKNLLIRSQQREVWIGYERGVYGVFKWVDDSHSKFTKWLRHKPDPDVNSRCASMIKSGEWVNYQCYYEQVFVCRKEPKIISTKSNLRVILTITISVSCIFIMFVFVAFLCVKSHKELEAVESQTKETIPFEIVKAAMVLPMSKPPDLLDHNKVKNTWQGTIKSISKKSDRNLQTLSTYSQNDGDNGVKPESISVEIHNEAKSRSKNNSRDNSRDGTRLKSNSANCLNNNNSGSSKSNPKSASNQSSPKVGSDTHLEKTDDADNTDSSKAALRSSPSYPSADAISLERPSSGDTNYLTKVDKWLKESPESPTRRQRVRETSVRRKHFQQSRNSQKGRTIPELEIDYSFDDDDAKALDNNNTIRDFKTKKTIKRQNVITVTADINMTRNNSSDIETPYSTSAAPSNASDTENGKSPSLSNGKRRKRPVFSQPDEIVNENFLFLKTLNYSQETEYSDLSDQRSDEKVEDRKFVDVDEKPKELIPKTEESDATIILREKKLKDEYQLVTFV